MLVKPDLKSWALLKGRVSLKMFVCHPSVPSLTPMFQL